MSIIENCVQFLEDLIAGDFKEEQMISAQIIGGLISLVPVMDQVMDVRDVSGSLYRINKHGGFAMATLDQKIDFGFSAFGVVPEVGSAFKTVFKPLYKQRKAAKGVMNGGVAMIERMLGQRKGGAVRWVHALDWAGNTQAAIVQANLALGSCIALLQYLGQGHWWCPTHLQQMARETAPELESMQGTLEAPIREAAGEIRSFLESMLGEHAAAVAMAVAGHAAAMRPVRGSTAGQKAGSSHHATQHKKVGEQARTQGKTSKGKVSSTVQKALWEAYDVLELSVQALMGEHITEHHVIEQKNWGLTWNAHDVISPAKGNLLEGWQSEHRKINDGGIPTYLCSPSTKVFENGIDSLWFTNRARPHQYAVVEAKANKSTTASVYSLLGEVQVPNQSKKSFSNRRSAPKANATASAAPKRKEPKMIMQMSRAWIEQKIERKHLNIKSKILNNYSRHVFLVTPGEMGEHMDALKEITKADLFGKPLLAQEYAHLHAIHNVCKEFGEKELDEAEDRYKAQGKFKRKK